MNPEIHAPSLVLEENLRSLPVRGSDYWNILECSRHIGLSNRTGKERHWVARVRLVNGRYKQQRLGLVKFCHPEGLSYDDAVEKARAWFASLKISSIASVLYAVSTNKELKYEKTVTEVTVGEAMRDYIARKRIAAAKTHFETNLSLINYHINPRLGDVRLSDFSGRVFTDFCLGVLRTPRSEGNAPLERNAALKA